MVRLEIAPREVQEPAKLRRALAKLEVEPQLIRRARRHVREVPGASRSIPRRRRRAGDGAARRACRSPRSCAPTRSPQGAQGIIGHVDADNKPVDGLELVARFHSARHSGLDDDLQGSERAESRVADRAGHGADQGKQRRPHDQRRSAGDRRKVARRRRLADGRRGRRHRHSRPERRRDPRDGEPPARSEADLRYGDHRTVRARVDDEAVHGGWPSRSRPGQRSRFGRHRKRCARDQGSRQPDSTTITPSAARRCRVVLRWSSNIGIVKFAERLSSREKFETLRDFGFGTPTGVTYPTESGGTLRAPASWSTQSPNSLAMGYEVAVTPLQLAAAYATFANGGELVEPSAGEGDHRARTGRCRSTHERRVVRRVVSKPVADKMRHMLLDVVDEGTALQAAVDNYLLAGKTGTPRATVRGRYVEGRYNPNFVGLFPADNPQYVIVVKLTAPRSSIFAAEHGRTGDQGHSAGGDRRARRGARSRASSPRAWCPRKRIRRSNP